MLSKLPFLFSYSTSLLSADKINFKKKLFGFIRYTKKTIALNNDTWSVIDNNVIING